MSWLRKFDGHAIPETPVTKAYRIPAGVSGRSIIYFIGSN